MVCWICSRRSPRTVLREADHWKRMLNPAFSVLMFRFSLQNNASRIYRYEFNCRGRLKSLALENAADFAKQLWIGDCLLASGFFGAGGDQLPFFGRAVLADREPRIAGGFVWGISVFDVDCSRPWADV